LVAMFQISSIMYSNTSKRTGCGIPPLSRDGQS
jgi:hypothetical protein